LELDRAAFQDTGLSARLDNILTKTLEILGLRSGAIRLPDGNGFFTLAAHRELPARYLKEMGRVPADQEPFSLILSGGPQLFPDIARDPRFEGSLFRQEGVKSLLLVPIRYEGRVVGTFSMVTFRGERTLTGEDLRFMDEAGARVALAILNSQRYEEARRQRRGLSLLFAVSRAVAQTLAQGEMLERALDALLAERDCLFAAAYLVREGEDPSGSLVLAHSRGSVELAPGLMEAMRKAGSSVRVRLDEAFAGKVSQVPDLAHERFEGSSALGNQGVRSLAVIPIRRQDAQSGVILLGGRTPFLSAKGIEDLFAALGTQLGIGIENARMVERRKRQVAHLSALTRGGQALARALDRKALLEEIRLQVMEVLSPKNFSLILTAEHGEGIEVGLSFRNGLRQDKGQFTQAWGLTGYILRTLKPLLTDDYDAECRRLGIEPPQSWGSPSRSWLGVPMLSSGRSLGALVIWDEEKPLAFGEEEKEVLSTIASQAAIAVENARLFGEAQHRIAELTALQKISTAIGFTFSEQRAAEVIVETVEELLGTHHVSLLTRVPGTDLFHRLAVWGKVTISDIPDKGFVSASDEQGVVAWVARTGQPMMVNDVRLEPRYRGIFPEVRSEVVVPILSRGSVIGVINVESESLGAFDQNILRLLSIVANQAGSALENSRLYAQARQKISDLTALYEIGLEITSTLGVDQILARIVDIAVARLKPFYCGFYRLTEEEPRELVTGPFFLGENSPPNSEVPGAPWVRLEGPGVIAWVAREGRAAFLPNVREDRRYLAGYQEIVSEIAVPLLAKGKVIGVLNVETDRPGAFTEATLEFLNTIAQQASVAVENARLYEMLEQSYFDTVRTLVLAMDAKDPYTRGHSERVRRYAVETARLLGMSEEDTKPVSYAGLLHDIGKIGVREDILLKPGELTPDEFEEVKQHSVMGEKLVHNVALLKGVGALIRSEHENYGGGGYPDGLFGEAIPLGARIIAVADAYDAMTTDRAYRHEMPIGVALDELRKCAGKQFDPKVVEALAKIVSEEKPEGS
jgi:GAF domain-containing protein